KAMAQEQPLRYVATASKAKREGRIFIDWLRNARGATSVASWSLRARKGAPVAMPLRWEELGRTKGSGDYDIVRALRRARSLKGHPWGVCVTLEQGLAQVRAAAGKRQAGSDWASCQRVNLYYRPAAARPRWPAVLRDSAQAQAMHWHGARVR